MSGMSPGRSRSDGRWIGKDREPEVEVGPESACVHLAPEIAVGGGDEPDVHRDVAVGAHAPDLPRLEHPEQLGLQVCRELADLVQEDRAAVRLLEDAQPPFGGAGERPLLVAEELGVEEVRGNCGAIDDPQGLAGPGAPGVDHLCRLALPGPGFTGQKHRDLARRRPLQQREGGPERDRRTDQASEAVRRGDLERVSFRQGLERQLELAELEHHALGELGLVASGSRSPGSRSGSRGPSPTPDRRGRRTPRSGSGRWSGRGSRSGSTDASRAGGGRRTNRTSCLRARRSGHAAGTSGPPGTIGSTTVTVFGVGSSESSAVFTTARPDTTAPKRRGPLGEERARGRWSSQQLRTSSPPRSGRPPGCRSGGIDPRSA